MNINGVEFKDLDFTDADTLEKIDEGVEIVKKEVKILEEKYNKDEIKTTAEGIRQECKIVKNFFDYVFGEGTSEKIFKGKDSLNLCLKAYEDVIEERDKQINAYNDKINKYSPDRLNR